MVFQLFPHAKVHIFSEMAKRCHDYLICAKEERVPIVRSSCAKGGSRSDVSDCRLSFFHFLILSFLQRLASVLDDDALVAIANLLAGQVDYSSL